MEPKYTNRLIHEKSPYLLQHAHNPVDWYPWGEEAFSKAKRENKPILLSIGYSSCHWCHVMEKESFEDETIAQIMNEHFVNIKVDREERPDVDEMYMSAVQLMTGSGGWPMTLFLTPDLIPFHAGTYFPPEDRGGMPGFKRVLKVVSEYYHSNLGEVEKIATHIKDAIQQMISISPHEEEMDDKIFISAFDTLKKQFDPIYGGFGKAPKFPNSLAISFLLRYWKRTGSQEALSIVELTLEKMAEGGIYDHLGGGFHRYSVDERWLIPHFEKMLYDNALISRIYFEAYQATRKEKYRRVGEETLQYVLREMRSPEGGFYSTQDADSEGKEGKFYTWTRNEVKQVLGREIGTPFCAYYGVSQHGNFEQDSSVLHIDSTLEKVSQLYGISVEDLKKQLEEGRKKLFFHRERRVKPDRDEKVLTSWNGLMISSLVDGFKVTEKEDYLHAARDGAQFILQKMKRDGDLLRVYFKGISQVKGYSEDYAFFIQALIDLYECTFDIRWLKEADYLNQKMIERFWDEKEGGFFFTGKGNGAPIARPKNPYDQALPSANSVAVFNLIRLGFLKGDESLKKMAERILRLFYPFFSKHPLSLPNWLSGLSFFLWPEEIGLVGSKNDPRIKSILKMIHLTYLPNKILSLRDPQESLEGKWFPFLMEKVIEETPTLFVCKNSTCLPPIKDEREMEKILSE